MNILAFDTSADFLNIALKTDNGFYEVNHQVGLKHSEHLLPQIEMLLKQAEITIEDIGLIVCARGPGSFTGLRIGFSTAKGLASGARIPLVSVPTIDIYAADCEKINSITIPVIDARKRRFYAALFQNGKRISEDLDTSSLDLIQACPKDAKIVITGPDAPKFIEEIHLLSHEIGIDAGFNRGHGRKMIDLGLMQYQVHGADCAEQGPTYIRKSEAEISRDKGLIK